MPSVRICSSDDLFTEDVWTIDLLERRVVRIEDGSCRQSIAWFGRGVELHKSGRFSQRFSLRLGGQPNGRSWNSYSVSVGWFEIAHLVNQQTKWHCCRSRMALVKFLVIGVQSDSRCSM